MKRVLIVGYGNPLRGDDGVGWHVAELYAGKHPRAKVQIQTCHQLSPELADLVSKVDQVIFIDASINGQPGEIGITQFETVTLAESAPGEFSHFMTPMALLQCVHDLYDYCPEALLFSIAGASFELDEQLSPEVLAAMPKMLTLLDNTIGRRR